MKKLLLLFVLCVLGSMNLQAQDDWNYWGIKAGLNLPHVADNSAGDFGLRTRVAWNLGVFKNFEISETFGLRVDLMYTQKGGRQRPEEFFLNISKIITVKTNYLSLPVTFQANRGRMFGEIGLEPGMQLDVNLVNENAGIDSQSIIDFWTSDFDLNGVIGVGVADQRFEISLRYLPGLITVSQELQVVDDNGQVIGTERFGRNNVFQLSLAYRIN